MPAAPLLTVEIYDPEFERRGQAVAYCSHLLQRAAEELSRSGGQISNGPLIGVSATGVPNTEVGHWTFLPGPGTGP
jgi:hypothetical protein